MNQRIEVCARMWSRREFIHSTPSAGGGLLIAFAWPAGRLKAEQNMTATRSPSAFLEIGADNTITVTSPAVEMGQGGRQAAAIIAAVCPRPDLLGAEGLKMLELQVNGKAYRVEAEPNTPLLWVLRDELDLTGTKFGCGIGACGACTVLMDGQATRACVVPVGTVAGKAVTTIEGLSGDRSHPVQQAWLAESVPQCGYCQSGMMLAAVALLKRKPQPTDADIDAAITNICRCGTYNRIRRAIHAAARRLPLVQL